MVAKSLGWLVIDNGQELFPISGRASDRQHAVPYRAGAKVLQNNMAWYGQDRRIVRKSRTIGEWIQVQG